MVDFKRPAEKLRRQRINTEIRKLIESAARVAGSTAIENIAKAIAAKDEDEFFYYRVTAKMEARDAFTYAEIAFQYQEEEEKK